ncbi:hypothetical protein C1X11_27855, partial [Escherichia coli]
RNNRGRFTVETFSRDDPTHGMQLVTRAPTMDVAVDAAINAMFDTDVQVARVIDRHSRAMVFRIKRKQCSSYMHRLLHSA